jgi:hypothetical protein
MSSNIWRRANALRSKSWLGGKDSVCWRAEERFTFVLRNSEMRNIAQESKQNKYNVALGDVLCVCGILACN